MTDVPIKNYLSSRLVLTDIDDTILTCRVFLEEFLDERLKTKAQSCAFNVREAYDIGEDVAHTLIHDFWRSDIMKRLPPEPCALEVLPRLYAQGWRFVAITACADEPAIVEARINNLQNAFGFEWDGIHCTGYNSVGPDGRNKKAEVLCKYPPTIWVEDSYQNALAGGLLGHKSFLIHRDHNSSEKFEHGLVTGIKSWYEIENFIAEHGEIS